MESKPFYVCKKFTAMDEHREPDGFYPYTIIHKTAAPFGSKFTLIGSSVMQKSLPSGEKKPARYEHYLIKNHRGRTFQAKFFAEADNIMADVLADLVTELNNADVILAKSNSATSYHDLCTMFGDTVSVGVQFIQDDESIENISRKMTSAHPEFTTLPDVFTAVKVLSDDVKAQYEDVIQRVTAVESAVIPKDLDDLMADVEQGESPLPFKSLSDAEDFLTSSTENFAMIRGLMASNPVFISEKKRVLRMKGLGKHDRLPCASLLSCLVTKDADALCGPNGSRFNLLKSRVGDLLVDRAQNLMGSTWRECPTAIIKRFQSHIRYEKGKLSVPEKKKRKHQADEPKSKQFKRIKNNRRGRPRVK